MHIIGSTPLASSVFLEAKIFSFLEAIGTWLGGDSRPGYRPQDEIESITWQVRQTQETLYQRPEVIRNSILDIEVHTYDYDLGRKIDKEIRERIEVFRGNLYGHEILVNISGPTSFQVQQDARGWLYKIYTTYTMTHKNKETQID